MKRLLVWLVFISLFAWRWWGIPSEVMVVGERVKLRLPTVDFPEYTDSATIVRRGKWEVRINNYLTWEPGDVVVVEGEWDGWRVIGDTARLCRECIGPNWGERVLIGVSYVRRWAVTRLEARLPEPMVSLAAGILLGVKRQMPKEFYQSLVNTGTLHIIAASGYNVMIVAAMIMAVVSRWLGRGAAIGAGVCGIWLYVLLAGGSASVVRAGVMGSLTLIAYYWGRVTEAKRLLWITAGVMLLVNPLYLVDVGWQLSVAATAGLLYLGPRLQKYIPGREYLVPTLAASLMTAPIIWWHFGRLSLISPLVNLFILPVVPMVMLLALLTVLVPWVSYVAYVPLWYLVVIIQFFG